MSPLTITYRDWDDLVSRVLPFASADQTLSVLRSVRVFERGGRLMAEATDRYAMAFAVAPQEVQAPEGFSVLLRTDTLVQLAKALGLTARTRSLVSVTLEPSEDGTTVKVSVDGGLLLLGDMTMTLRQTEGEYPPIARLISDARKRDIEPAPGFSAWILARLGRAVRDQDVICIEEHGLKPAYFADSEETIAGLVTPVRGPGASRVLLDLYAPPAKSGEDSEATAEAVSA